MKEWKSRYVTTADPNFQHLFSSVKDESWGAIREATNGDVYNTHQSARLSSCFLVLKTPGGSGCGSVVGILPVLWETWMEFLVPGFSPAQSQLLQAFGE